LPRSRSSSAPGRRRPGTGQGTGPGERVEATTPSATEIVLTRTFAAPRTLVFAAHTQPALLVRWYGARGWTLAECAVDLRVGGAWRFVSHGPEGAVMVQHGVYQEVVPPERLVYTETFAADPVPVDEHPVIVTVAFAEHGGRTTVTGTLRFPSQAARDARLATRMLGGTNEAFDRLAATLAELGDTR
jgi:uncharacterized protein YndB with AHSA1/START domain